MKKQSLIVVLGILASTHLAAAAATNRSLVRNLTLTPLNNQPQHEIIANATAGALRFSSNQTEIGLGAGYGYFLPYGLEATFATSMDYLSQSMDAGFGFQTQSQSRTVFNLLVGPAYNLTVDGNLRNAFFVSFQAGFEMAPGVTSFAFASDLGKRFALFQNIAYAPRVGINKGVGEFTFHVVPIAASFLF